MDGHSAAAFHWTERLDPKTWCKSFFSVFPKCDILLNNNSEVFNSYILEGREMPVMSMLEYIFYKIMQRLVSKQRGHREVGRAENMPKDQEETRQEH